ncbi:MAG: hypothetical protein ACYC96_15225 [Fimbriimonadaceae bacterium]
MAELQYRSDNHIQRVELRKDTVVTIRIQATNPTVSPIGIASKVEVIHPPALSPSPEIVARIEKTEATGFHLDLKKASQVMSPRNDGALASEGVLKRIWDKPEEDEAWRDL